MKADVQEPEGPTVSQIGFGGYLSRGHPHGLSITHTDTQTHTHTHTHRCRQDSAGLCNGQSGNTDNNQELREIDRNISPPMYCIMLYQELRIKNM